MNEPEVPTHSSLSRRGLIGGALAAGAAGTLVGVPGLAAAAGKPATGKVEKRAATVFFKDEALNFQMLFALGGAGYGASELGEVLATFDRIHAKGDTYRATYEEFLRLGRQTRERADKEHAAGRAESARSSYLRAAMYLDQALFFTLASKTPTRHQEGVVYAEMEGAFAKAAALFQPRFEPVRIPWSGGTMPGWLLSPGGGGRRPTVILNNGSDAQNIDMFVYGGAAAIERGWNALILEGPGQGSNLFLRSQVFIPDWERVIIPVVDFLRARPEVDRRRISLIGQSFGGYLTARAAAHEHRLAALVTDPGCHDPFVDWQHELPPSLLKLLSEEKAEEFDRIWDEIPSHLSEAEAFGVAKRSEIYGNGGGYERMSNARRFVLQRAEARQITAPTAICSPELENFFPGQPQTMHKWLGAQSTLLKFTVAEGAEYHCEPMAPQLRNERVFDWLERTRSRSEGERLRVEVVEVGEFSSVGFGVANAWVPKEHGGDGAISAAAVPGRCRGLRLAWRGRLLRRRTAGDLGALRADRGLRLALLRRRHAPRNLNTAVPRVVR